MKNYLSQKYRLTENLSKKGKKETIFYQILYFTIFVLCSFAFFEALYTICNMIGSVVSLSNYQAAAELARVFPSLLGFLYLIYLSTYIDRMYRRVSHEASHLLTFKAGIANIIVGGIVTLYVFCAYIVGTYSSVVEGYPTMLYPLDVMVLGILLLASGILMVILYKKNIFKRYQSEMCTYLAKKRNVASQIFRIIYYMATCFAFGALLFLFFIADLSHGHEAYSIALFLMLLLPVVMLVVQKVVYKPLKLEFKTEFQLKYAIIFIVAAICIYAFYMVALSLDPNAPNDVAYGLLPVEFTASVNAFTYIYGIVNLAAPLTALIGAFVKLKNEKNK